MEKGMTQMSNKTQQLKTMPSSSLVALFAEAAAATGRALESAKPRLVNKAYDVKKNVYRELRSRGIEAQKYCLGLLDDPDRYVRYEAATYALDFAPQAAEPVLQALEKL